MDMWGEDWFRQMTAKGRLLFVYMTAGPPSHGRPEGLLLFDKDEAAAHTGLAPSEVERELERLEQDGIIEVEGDVVYIPQALALNPPCSKLNVTAWVRMLQAMPESKLVNKWLTALLAVVPKKKLPPQLAEMAGSALPLMACPIGEVSSPRRKRPRRGEVWSEEAMKVAQYLASEIEKHGLRKPTQASLRSWAVAITRLHAIDKAAWPDIWKVARFSQQDDFWSRNVLSGAKLRKHYDRLRLEMVRADRRSSDPFQNFASGDGA